MTINTSTEAVKAIIYGLRQLTNEWVASNAANLIEALLAERDCSETKAAEAMREAAAKVCDDDEDELAYSVKYDNWPSREHALKLAAAAIRALPLSPQPRKIEPRRTL
jgi:hypothetical protein